MFNDENKRKPEPVELMMTDRRTLVGNLLLPMDVKLKRVLNSDGDGLEFENEDGIQSVIAKTAIVEIISRAAVEASAPATVAPDSTQDPLQTLGLAAGASEEQIKAAYDALRREYNPDRYASVGLPKDVLQYVIDKSKCIDVAYVALQHAAAYPFASTAPAAAVPAT